MEAVRKADPRRAEWANVAAQWRAAIGVAEQVTVAEVVRLAGKRAELRDALIAVAGEQRAVNNRRLGKWLAEVSGRIVSVTIPEERLAQTLQTLQTHRAHRRKAWPDFSMRLVSAVAARTSRAVERTMSHQMLCDQKPVAFK
jgi:hypothetical protein